MHTRDFEYKFSKQTYRRALTKGPGVLYKSCNKGGYFTYGQSIMYPCKVPGVQNYISQILLILIGLLTTVPAAQSIYNTLTLIYSILDHSMTLIFYAWGINANCHWLL